MVPSAIGGIHAVASQNLIVLPDRVPKVEASTAIQSAGIGSAPDRFARPLLARHRSAWAGSMAAVTAGRTGPWRRSMAAGNAVGLERTGLRFMQTFQPIHREYSQDVTRVTSVRTNTSHHSQLYFPKVSLTTILRNLANRSFHFLSFLCLSIRFPVVRRFRLSLSFELLDLVSLVIRGSRSFHFPRLLM